MARARLPDRGIIEISGDDAPEFINNLVTNSVLDLEMNKARFAALLTPQGKIIVDGFFVRITAGFLIDIPRALAPDLIKRLTLYKLRAKVTVTDRSEDYHLVAGWNEPHPASQDCIVCFDDPRLSEMGWRMIVDTTHMLIADDHSDPSPYHHHRITLGIPEGGKDFIYSDAFPHEADMDQLNGIDFRKGCYVGQEIVSRMQHRGSARTRAIPVRFEDGLLPESGSSAEAQGKQIGSIGSGTKGGLAIAILRLDRVEEALAASANLTAGGLAFSLETRPWIGFSVPRSK